MLQREMPTHLDTVAAEQILRRYDILPPATEHGGSRKLHGGHEAAIGGHLRDDGQKMVTLTVGNISEARPCPFKNGESREIVERFFDLHRLPRHNAFELMLEHLIDRAANMYAQEPLDAFLFQKIRLHDSGYQIGSVDMVTGARKHGGRSSGSHPSSRLGPRDAAARFREGHRRE